MHALAQNQNDAYRAIHWGVDDGLSEGETYNMIKDVNGFLWIGTRYGLNRFDGNSFKIYLHERNNSKSLIANNVNMLVEDSLHNIWIGSYKGISRYNINKEDFTNFFPDTTIRNDDHYIIPFWATKTDVLCLEGDSIITAYNIHSTAKRTLANLDEYKGKLIGLADDYCIFDYNSNSIWCLAENPEATPGLLQINLSAKQNLFFPFQYHRKKDSQGFAEASCYDAKRKCIWINSTQGLLQFTLIDKQFHHINALSKYEHLINYDRFVGITIDKQDRIWFATDPKGIIIYNPGDESVSFPLPADSVMQYSASFANACLYCDRDGIIWSGSWLKTGLYALIPYAPIIEHYISKPGKGLLSSDRVITAADAGKGKVWLGTAGGINILDTKTGTFQLLQQKDLHGLKTNDGVIGPIAIDTIRQKAWLYSCWDYWPRDFFKEDMTTKKCTRILVRNLNNQVVPLVGSPVFDGNKIFFFGNHISVLDLNSDTAQEILSVSDPYYLINSVAVANHFLFLQGNTDGEYNQTYEKKNGKWMRVYTRIDSIGWTSIAYINNTYWVAGDSRLFHLDSNFYVIRTYSAENGLPNLPVTGLINDNNGNIWFHTDRSIQELNITTGEIKTMSELDGFEKQTFDLLPYSTKDANGNIYFCGGTLSIGFNKITPWNFTPPASIVYLKSLRINQRPFPLKESINYTDTLSLKYYQTKIQIETGIIDFYSKGKSILRYKLEGRSVNENWQYAPYYYTIRYDGLQPGNYKLIMQASNTSNEFNGPEKALFINITPAFWNTWWFRIAATVCIVLLFYSLIRLRLHQQFKSRLLRSENEKQLAELREKASQLEMETLRSQMNPHFIFNCLSSINRFILKNKTEEASDYLTKFSRLIRMVLNNSKQSFISLEDELETLRLYLEMQRFRFKNSFDYSFIYTNNVDISNIFIPPLLLQPFAENAIWHGLMHKQEKGFLNFDFSTEEKILSCIITDNGVGRKQAELLKSKSAEKQKSMGLKITTERLSLLNNKSNQETFFTIEDLTDENGNATGTRVHLKIFYKEMMEV